MDSLSIVPIPCPLLSLSTERPWGRLPGKHGTAEPEILLMDAGHPERKNAEAMVQQVFQRSYAVRLKTFYPFLLGIKGTDGAYRAVAGIRPGSHSLFAEHYLDSPVEDLLAVPRNDVVEIGNLATRRSGEIRWIIAAVTAFLHGAGFRRVLFTITPLLRNSFRRMGLPLHHLADARQECLPEAMAEDWGAYYDSEPEVCYGRIAIGYRSFRKTICSSERLRHTWEKALCLGEATGRRLREEEA